jgi:hypothetical protein
MSKSSRKQKRRTRAGADWRTKALTLRDQLVEALPDPTGEIDLAIERFQTGVTGVQARFEEIEWETEKRAHRFMRRLRGSTFGKQLQAMPKQVVSGVDRLLETVGLMRTARHEVLMSRAKHRAKGNGKRKPASQAAAVA